MTTPTTREQRKSKLIKKVTEENYDDDDLRMIALFELIHHKESWPDPAVLKEYLSTIYFRYQRLNEEQEMLNQTNQAGYYALCTARCVQCVLKFIRDDLLLDEGDLSLEEKIDLMIEQFEGLIRLAEVLGEYLDLYGYIQNLEWREELETIHS